jgi:hypothetical protein
MNRKEKTTRGEWNWNGDKQQHQGWRERRRRFLEGMDG